MSKDSEPVIHTSRFTHGNRFNEVLWSHVQLPLILHRAEHAEAILVGRHVHVSIVKVIWTCLQMEKQNTNENLLFVSCHQSRDICLMFHPGFDALVLTSHQPPSFRLIVSVC